MTTLLQDFRYGIRMAAKNPGFTVVVVLALGLGIGANTAIFSAIDALLLRPLPFKDPKQLVILSARNQRFGFSGVGAVCDADYAQWRTQNRVFEPISAYHNDILNLTGSGEPLRLRGAVVTSSFFPLLGVTPIVGRSFLSEDERAGHGNVVVLGHQLWQDHFSSDPNMAGKPVILNGNSFTVVGVMPPGFRFPNEAELWSPLVLTSDCSNAFLQVIGRLKPGVTLDRAQSEMQLLAKRLSQQHGRSDDDWVQSFAPLHEALVSNIQPALLMIFAAVTLVLLIACANVANLLLARTAERQREIAVRKALGAGRWRIARQFLVESVLLAAAGGALGLLLALWTRDILMGLLPEQIGVPGALLRAASIAIDTRVLGFALLISFFTGILLGLAPALQGATLDLQSTLKDGKSLGLHRRRIQGALVIGEVALALVLLIGAGLLIKSFWRLLQVKPGFDPQNVLTVNVALPPSQYSTAPAMKGFHQQALARIQALPEVRYAGLIGVFGLPLGDGGIFGDYTVEGNPPSPPELLASKSVVSPGYLSAMGIPLVRGRMFNEHDNEHAPKVIIVSQGMARHFWSGQDPMGKRVNPGFSGSPWYSVVGVVGDVKQRGLTKSAPFAIYIPYLQAPKPFFLGFVTFVVRTASDPISAAAAVRREIQSVDKDLPVFDVRTMQQVVSRSTSEPRFNVVLLGSFAILALVLAALGVYGVLAYSVSQRAHEMGIRLALGAQRGDLLKMVVSEGMLLVLIGLAAGLAGALALTRVLSRFLFGVGATDPVTFIVVSLLLASVAALASYIPASRATRVDPMVALRYE